MEYDNGEHYLKEIDHVSILEYIDEVFDSATSLMTPNSVMYGSTITAVIAGLPIVGDLDIAVSNQEYMQLCQNFSSSVKWIQVEGKTIPERRAPCPGSTQRLALPDAKSNAEGKTAAAHSSPHKKGKNPYEQSKHLPITKVVAFKTVNDGRVQIMESKAMTGDRLEDALEIVRKVDFTFCGIAIDMYGRMLEVIPLAYDDCKQRVIRIQNYQPRLDPAHLKQRLQKYTKRGWGLTMSIDQALINLDRAKREYDEKVAKQRKVKPRKKPTSGFHTKKLKQGVAIVAKKEFLRMLGSNSVVRDNIRQTATINFNIGLTTGDTGSGTIEFHATPTDVKKLTLHVANEIIRLTDAKIRSKYRISEANYDESLKTEKKMSVMSEMYGDASNPYDSAYKGGSTLSSSTTTTGNISTDPHRQINRFNS